MRSGSDHRADRARSAGLVLPAVSPSPAGVPVPSAGVSEDSPAPTPPTLPLAVDAASPAETARVGFGSDRAVAWRGVSEPRRGRLKFHTGSRRAKSKNSL